MFSGKFGLVTSWMAGAVLALAAPALAQTGRVQGKVVDDKDAAVQGARVTITDIPEQGGQKWVATTDKNGNYVIATLPRSGNYLVVAEKDGVGIDEARLTVKVGNLVTTNFKLSARVRMTEAQAKQNAAARKAFEEGVAAANAGSNDAAIAAFTTAAAGIPNCADCYFNIGLSQQRAKNYDQAEAAFNEAIKLRPSYPEAYNALASVYSAQNKMDQAAAAASKSAELSVASATGGSADQLYNSGVALWNANKFPEAGTAFESALKTDPNHAEAHFMLGKVYINLGKLKEAAGEYDTYLKLAPTGKNAAEAKTTYEALKPMLK